MTSPNHRGPQSYNTLDKEKQLNFQMFGETETKNIVLILLYLNNVSDLNCFCLLLFHFF